MAAPTPKQRAVTMKRNGMDDSLVGAILGLSSEDVRSLLYDADPDVTLGGGLGLIAAELEIELPLEQSAGNSGVSEVEWASLSLDAGYYLVFVGYTADPQPDDLSATGYLRVGEQSWPVFTRQSAGNLTVSIGQASGVDVRDVFALVAVAEVTEVSFYAYGPGEDDILTVTDFFMGALQLA